MVGFNVANISPLLLLLLAKSAFALGLPAFGGDDSGLSLIAIGGNQGLHDTGPDTDTVDIISLATNSHKAGATSPKANSKFGSVLVNDTIYVVGGDFRDTFWAYSVPTNTWTQMPDFPRSVAGITLVEINGKLIATGGSEDGDGVKQVFSYDLSKGSKGDWVGVANTPDGDYGHDFPCAVVLNGSIYYVNRDTFYSSDDSGASWTQYSERLHIAVYLQACVAVGEDTIWVIGGHGSQYLIPDVQVFNITSKTISLSKVKEMPKGRHGHAAVVLPDSGDVLVCGGVQNDAAFTDCLTYSVKDKNWTTSKYVLDKPRAQFGLFVAKTSTNKVY